MSEVVRIGSIIIFYPSNLWGKAKFFILCDIIFPERLQEKFEIDHSWKRKGLDLVALVSKPKIILMLEASDSLYTSDASKQAMWERLRHFLGPRKEGYPCPSSEFQSLVCRYFGRFPCRCRNFDKTSIACRHFVALVSLFQGRVASRNVPLTGPFFCVWTDRASAQNTDHSGKRATGTLVCVQEELATVPVHSLSMRSVSMRKTTTILSFANLQCFQLPPHSRKQTAWGWGNPKHCQYVKKTHVPRDTGSLILRIVKTLRCSIQDRTGHCQEWKG